MSETTNETIVPEAAADDHHMAQDVQQAKANDGTEVEFTIPNLLNNVATALHQLLSPNGQRFFVMVTGAPSQEGTVEMNTVSSVTPEVLPQLLREQAAAIEQNQMARAATPEEFEKALADLGLDMRADPADAAAEVSNEEAKPASS
jgi:hypothetical protein